MYLANGSPAELLTLRGRAYHLATAGKDDLVAELNRRGYAVAVITPQELIKAIEGADVPVPPSLTAPNGWRNTARPLKR